MQEYKRIASEIREFYFKGAAIDEKTLIQYIDLLSDINFAYGIDKSARQHAEKTNQKTFYARYLLFPWNFKKKIISFWFFLSDSPLTPSWV